MPKHRLSFTLKQHTPIIHFQADQPGATLRATELKPKLDRFLLEHEPNLKYRKHPNGDRSLDYKVRIYFDGNARNSIDYPKTYVKKGEEGYLSPYFADGVSIEHETAVKVSFRSFDKDLLRAIKKHFATFLAFENFGTRQSKGFGCYYLHDKDLSAFEMELHKHPNPIYKLKKRAGNKKALEEINEFYKYLKSGINYPHRKLYKKSLLFQYMCNEKIGWEKRRLKQVFPQIVHGNHEAINCSNPKEYRYIRSMLGLAELNEYRPKGSNKKIKIESTEKVKEGGKTRPKYQRFKSPVTFKVFDNHIYLIHNHSYREILGKSFDFKLDRKTEKIKTPTDFNLTEFLDFVASHGLITQLKGDA